MLDAALVLAAGAGTRMKSKKPKVTHEVLGKPLVRWVVDAAKTAGIDNVICVVGNGREYVAPLVEDTTVVIQEEQLGTAHAVLAAKDACSDVDGSLVVLTGDSPLITPETIEELISVRRTENAAVVVLTVEMADPFGYGRIIRNDADEVVGIVEQKDCSEEQAAITECNSGFYCFDASLLFDLLQQVSAENAQKEYYLTDVLHLARVAGKKVIGLKANDPDECRGINSRIQLAEATKALQHRINTAHMVAGVTIFDPDTVWIGPDVEIGQDCQILPMSMLLGSTQVGENTIIGPNSRLTDCVVGNNCTIDETVAIEAQIDNDVDCGPRAYLRPGTHMMDGSKAGTHVEIKKSTVGKGSKVPHLTYLGDATLGSGVNIGAGSITCNYDGVNKWPTTVGDDAFIGSDTMLVAPVNVGSNTLIAAGSVITEDVPDDALALGRARQVIKEGYRSKE